MLKLLAMLALAAAVPVSAQDMPSDPAARGRALAEDAERRDDGWKDAQASFVMVLSGKSGPMATRQLSFKAIEMKEAGRGDKSLIVFNAPRDVKDTALLTFARDKGVDDQWIYLPALKRVKRIASANKSGPFMGSEFSYEDFAQAGIDKFTYRWLREEKCGAGTCDVLERMPAYEKSGYSRQVIWMDRPARRILRIDCYDLRGKLLKSLYSRKWVLYQNRFWRALDLLMVNAQNGKMTQLSWGPITFGAGIPEADLDPARLAQN